jgi:hypothetical protein
MKIRNVNPNFQYNHNETYGTGTRTLAVSFRRVEKTWGLQHLSSDCHNLPLDSGITTVYAMVFCILDHPVFLHIFTNGAPRPNPECSL